MWRNEVIKAMAEELRKRNADLLEARREHDAAVSAREEFLAAGASEAQLAEAGIATKEQIELSASKVRGKVPVSFYGMDVYSVQRSAKAVVEFLEMVDPEAAVAARSNYSVLHAYTATEGNDEDDSDMKRYAREVVAGELRPMADDISIQLIATLGALQRQNRGQYSLMLGPAELLDAEQNAEVVVNGEAYFRGLYTDGSVATWNLRDQHMVQTLLRLQNFHEAADGAAPKVVLWAHNSHVGDARATEMGKHAEWNLGQMCRQTFGSNNVFLLGFGTYEGTVTAATEWGGAAQTFELNPAEEGSHSDMMHCALPGIRERLGNEALNSFLLLLRGDGPEHKAVRAALGSPKRQRAVGVKYKKDTEAVSHYVKADLAAQFDAWIHVETSTALRPLPLG